MEWSGMITAGGQSIAQLTTEFVWVGITKGNKFAVGEIVLYKGSQYKITGSNGTTEYALEGYAFLVWEDELEELT